MPVSHRPPLCPHSFTCVPVSHSPPLCLYIFTCVPVSHSSPFCPHSFTWQMFVAVNHRSASRPLASATPSILHPHQDSSQIPCFSLSHGDPAAFHLEGHRFRTRDIASPLSVNLLIPVFVISPDSFHQLSQNTLIFQVNLCKGNSGGSCCGPATPACPFP